MPGPVRPHDRSEQHGEGPDLADAEHEDERREDRREGHAHDGETDSGQAGLDERRDDDPQRDAPNRLRGEPGGTLAVASRHASSEAPRRFGGRLAGCVKDGREENDQQELHQHHPDAAHRDDEPAEHQLRIGRHARRELFAFDRGGLLPLRGESGAGQGQSHEPVRRRGHGPGGQRPGPTGDVVGVHDDRAEGERERQDQAEQQDRRHHGHRQPPPTPQRRLHAQHQGPGRDHDHRGPDRREQERLQDPKARHDQSGDEEHRQRGPRRIPGGGGVGHARRVIIGAPIVGRRARTDRRRGWPTDRIGWPES